MTIFATIKADYLTARKAKDMIAVPLLSTLIGEATAIGKADGNRDTTDLEAVALIKKFIKGIRETLDALKVEGGAAVMALQAEQAILEKYLPKQLSDDELKEHIANIVAVQGANTPQPKMGDVMKELKARYDGQYDGKTASAMIKAALQ